MEPELFYRTKVTVPTAVYRRWHTAHGYIDSKGNALTQTAEEIPETPGPEEIEAGPDPSIPLEDGYAPFLDLPTEIRLQIYGYLTEDKKKINEIVDSQFSTTISTPKSAPSTTYAYLYRSPGRITKANVINREVIKLFHVDHRIREELLDTCYGDRTFVLEASLHSRSVGGLDVLPPRLGMTAWVKKLLLITTLDSDACQPKGIADLRPLQEMTNLKELRILFRAVDAVDPVKVANSPIRAILSCVPPTTKVSIGANAALQVELLSELGHSVDYLFAGNANAVIGYDKLNENMEALNEKRGNLSGSRVNHGICRSPTCQESDLGISCINSQTPGLQPLADSQAPAWQQERLKYHCGCIIMKGDGGYMAHGCQAKVLNDLARAKEALEKLERMQPQLQEPKQEQEVIEDWRASLQRTRRRWKSWGAQ